MTDTEEKVSLPLLPTGKPHVSFSEVKCWKECSFRHKLMHIDKIEMGEPSPYLPFGTAVHAGCESLIESKSVDRDKIITEFKSEWDRMNFDDPAWISRQPGWYKHAPFDTWSKWANEMWDDVLGFLDEEFPAGRSSRRRRTCTRTSTTSVSSLRASWTVSSRCPTRRATGTSTGSSTGRRHSPTAGSARRSRTS